MTTDTFPSIKIRCIPDNPYAVIGVLNSKRVRLEIETKRDAHDVEVDKRIPLNLVLVLDRSGSMASNNKLEFAKQAVVNVLNLLHDDDIVHLVAYDDKIWTVFENARASTRQALYSIVRGIHSGNTTNISGGIETGVHLLEKYPYPGYSKRMLVLSDGLANVGLKTKEEIMKVVTEYREQGVIIDSFGVGADFDEKVMKGIAEAGCGQFFFLETAEVIESLITKALQSVFKVCGAHAQLIVRGRNNAIVTKIWGHENAALGASLGDLHVDNMRALLCDFTVSGTVSPGAEVEVLDYQLKYHRPGDTEGEPLVTGDTLSIFFVDDETLIRTIDPRVRTLHAVQVAAEMDDRLAALMEEHKRDDALKVIAEQITLLKEVQHLDDDRGMIAMLIRMAESMEKRLKENVVSEKTAAKYYGHHGHLKKCYDSGYAKHYDD